MKNFISFLLSYIIPILLIFVQTMFFKQPEPTFFDVLILVGIIKVYSELLKNTKNE